ncbi:hypothetical protein ACUH95_07165 [Dermabacteraceae bacterium P13101]
MFPIILFFLFALLTAGAVILLVALPHMSLNSDQSTAEKRRGSRSRGQRAARKDAKDSES